MRTALWTVGLLAAVAAAPAAAADCAALAKVRLAAAEVTGAAVIPADAPPFNQKLPFCRVTVTARPSADSDVRLELWIPAGQAWNGKFLQVGNGGFAGQIPYRLLALGLGAGYAVAGTDDGHQSQDGTDASWALGHPEKLVDFGWRAVKATTVAAKAVLAAYGPASKSYFWGCSDGGREALMTAQRYPNDFDGIVAGAAANNWTGLQAGAALVGQTLHRAGASIPVAKLPVIQAAALKACGGGSWVADQAACRFDPVVLKCKSAATDQCLTTPEVAAARAIYRGARNPATGARLPGLKPGAEAQPGSWANWLLGPNNGAGVTDRPAGFAGNWFSYVVRGDAKFRVADVTRADFAASEKLAGTINSTDPDLSAFRAHGGKLIQYHGWNDPAISPDYSIAYTGAVKAKMGDIAGFHRLYLVPGMLHCTGGASPTQVDWLSALDAWVDKGSAPVALVAHGMDGATQTLTPAIVPAGGKAVSR